jgi:hypothetical protein
LRVGYNNLSGKVRSFLGNMPQLHVLGLVHNHYSFEWHGRIGAAPFRRIEVSGTRKEFLLIKPTTYSPFMQAVRSANNTYKWFKDGALYATINGDSTFNVH